MKSTLRLSTQEDLQRLINTLRQAQQETMNRIRKNISPVNYKKVKTSLDVYPN